jgi:hypothetical protein
MDGRFKRKISAKDIAHINLYMSDPYYATLDLKPTVAQQTTICY